MGLGDRRGLREGEAAPWGKRTLHSITGKSITLHCLTGPSDPGSGDNQLDMFNPCACAAQLIQSSVSACVGCSG